MKLQPITDPCNETSICAFFKLCEDGSMKNVHTPSLATHFVEIEELPVQAEIRKARQEFEQEFNCPQVIDSVTAVFETIGDGVYYHDITRGAWYYKLQQRNLLETFHPKPKTQE